MHIQIAFYCLVSICNADFVHAHRHKRVSFGKQLVINDDISKETECENGPFARYAGKRKPVTNAGRNDANYSCGGNAHLLLLRSVATVNNHFA